jgi:hypothetical protein
VVESTPLLRERTGDRTEGSNPSRSANCWTHRSFRILILVGNHFFGGPLEFQQGAVANAGKIEPPPEPPIASRFRAASPSVDSADNLLKWKLMPLS